MKRILFYTDSDLLLPVIDDFKTAYPVLTITVISSIDNLRASIKTVKPEAILIYMGSTESYVPALKELRKRRDISTKPVIVFPQLPTRKDLEEKLFNFL